MLIVQTCCGGNADVFVAQQRACVVIQAGSLNDKVALGRQATTGVIELPGSYPDVTGCLYQTLLAVVEQALAGNCQIGIGRVDLAMRIAQVSGADLGMPVGNNTTFVVG